MVKVGPVSTADLPAVVTADLNPNVLQAANTTFNAAAAAAPPLPPGGIQIAGIARDIYVRYNEIEGGCGNGITLGGLMLVDGNGVQVNGYVGYNPAGGTPDPCGKGNIFYPGTVVFGNQNANVVVDGRLTDIHIENNRIRNMGLCGIGPIGFFDLGKSPEVVTVSGLWIVANEIADCLSRTLTQYSAAQSTMLGYGGICLPDVTLVVIRDNVILNTGATLADPVTGIFVLHGAQVEISRNQIQDTRTTTPSFTNAAPSGFRAGISLIMVTPLDTPGAASSTWTTSTNATGVHKAPSLYAHGAPALIVQENIVDIPLGLALSVAGLGAFSIYGNHFSTGGVQSSAPVAGCVFIVNLGSAVESPVAVTTAEDWLALLAALNSGATTAQAYQSVYGSVTSVVGAIAPGPVNFSHNRCSLRPFFPPHEVVTSILIGTYDDLGFHNNQCWVAGGGLAACDALLVGISARVTGNRFQEPLGALTFSVLTAGAVATIISLNEGSNVMEVLAPPAQTYSTGNVRL